MVARRGGELPVCPGFTTLLAEENLETQLGRDPIAADPLVPGGYHAIMKTDVPRADSLTTNKSLHLLILYFYFYASFLKRLGGNSMTNLTLKASVMLFAALVSVAAYAQPPNRTHLRAVSVAELKANYLECDQLASSTLLDFSTAVECSMVSEELLDRGFGGSFKQLLEWWRSARNNCTLDAGCETP